MARTKEDIGLFPVVIGLGVVSLLAFARKGIQAQKLDVSVETIKGKREDSNVRLKFDLSVYNPNEKPIQFKKFVGNLLYDKKRIANIDVNSEMEFPARSKVTLPVDTIIPIARLTANILDALNKLLSKTAIVMELEGVLYAENLKIPVNETFDLNLNV